MVYLIKPAESKATVIADLESLGLGNAPLDQRIALARLAALGLIRGDAYVLHVLSALL